MNEIAAVGLSQQWNSDEAGKEVAQDLLKHMDEESPDLVLLFSTIHYKDHGGFEKLLKSIYEILPKNTKIIGGTVAGFIIPQGCYTHGVAAYGIKTKEIQYSIGVTYNIKRDPKKAAEICAEKIKNELRSSQLKNKFILTLPSGITTPKIPGLSEKRVIRSKILSKLLIIGTKISLLLFQKGPGREEIIIETLANKLSDYKMIGGSFIDDNKGYYNYQFYNDKVGTNMLIVLGIATDYSLNVNSNFGLKARGEKFHITKNSTYGLVIEKINNKNAFDEILHVLKWPAYFLEDGVKILKRTFYAPIGYVVDGKLYTSTIAFIMGEGIVISPKVKCEEAQIMTASGKDLINAVDKNLADTKNKNIKMGFISSCIVRLETLGAYNYKVHQKLKEHFKNSPFIEIFLVGEDVYTQEIGAKRITTSHNTAIFYDEK